MTGKKILRVKFSRTWLPKRPKVFLVVRVRLSTVAHILLGAAYTAAGPTNYQSHCTSSRCGRGVHQKKTFPLGRNSLGCPHPGDLLRRRCTRWFAFTRRGAGRVGSPLAHPRLIKRLFCRGTSGRRKMGVLCRPHSTHSYLAATAADDGCGYRDLALYGSIALARINVGSCAHAKATRFFAQPPDERIDSLSLCVWCCAWNSDAARWREGAFVCTVRSLHLAIFSCAPLACAAEIKMPPRVDGLIKWWNNKLQTGCFATKLKTKD